MTARVAAAEAGRCRLTLSNLVLKAPTASAIGTIYNELVSNVAFNFNLRCYTEVAAAATGMELLEYRRASAALAADCQRAVAAAEVGRCRLNR
jgi:hypothetical protein